MKFEVREIEGQGRGLIAAETIQKGDEIFRESPIVAKVNGNPDEGTCILVFNFDEYFQAKEYVSKNLAEIFRAARIAGSLQKMKITIQMCYSLTSARETALSSTWKNLEISLN